MQININLTGLCCSNVWIFEFRFSFNDFKNDYFTKMDILYEHEFAHFWQLFPILVRVSLLFSFFDILFPSEQKININNSSRFVEQKLRSIKMLRYSSSSICVSKCSNHFRYLCICICIYIYVHFPPRFFSIWFDKLIYIFILSVEHQWECGNIQYRWK